MHTVSTYTYDAPPYDRREILRYAGVRGEAPDVEELLTACISELDRTLSYRVCACELPITRRENAIDLGFAEACSHALQKNLDGCESILLFAATVGMGVDRLAARYAPLSPTKSLLFGAIGAERIEALCERFCADMRKTYAPRGYSLRPRFSPGYGDLPLSLQREIFAVLDCPRKIGLSLNESLLMSPSKSVTAIIGLYPSLPS